MEQDTNFKLKMKWWILAQKEKDSGPWVLKSTKSDTYGLDVNDCDRRGKHDLQIFFDQILSTFLLGRI